MSYRVEAHGALHVTMRIWVNGALAGALTVRSTETTLLDWIEGALIVAGATLESSSPLEVSDG